VRVADVGRKEFEEAHRGARAGGQSSSSGVQHPRAAQRRHSERAADMHRTCAPLKRSCPSP
jgi:hypothetical protein